MQGNNPSVQNRPKKAASTTTPLVNERWYVAGRSDEITDAPMDRWLLNQTVLLYRARDGAVVALDNRCPHRSFPLVRGRRVDDAIVCGYHGLTFGRDGRCLRVPTLKSPPSNLAIRCFPVVERKPIVWIWMGDPTRADAQRIPEHFELNSPAWPGVTNYARIDANYVDLHENLQDLTHFTFLHGSSIGIPAFESTDLQVDVDAERVLTRRESRALPPPALWADTLPLRGDEIDRVITTTFKGPALCDGTMVITDLASERRYTAQILHFITPETNRTTHYWWFVLRDFGVTEVVIADKLLAGFSSTFHEDKQALEAIEQMKVRDSRRDFVEKSFAADRAGIQMRMSIQALADAEASSLD
jgi:phenylpropionate dioxygenase-like ring-hydroxylating dioxygenase large terminal subunit